MKTKIKIAIAEDHDLFREGMLALLEQERGLEVCFDVGNGQALLNKLSTENVDVVLLDLDMPILSGQEALRVINSNYPTIKVIIVSMYYVDDFIIQTLSLGARGFIPKSASIETVIDAIYSVHEQGYYFEDRVSRTLLYEIATNKDLIPTFHTKSLSNRETEVVRLICQEKTNKEIADLLCLSVRTVESHRKSIMKKTNSKNLAGIIIFAIKTGIYSLDTLN